MFGTLHRLLRVVVSAALLFCMVSSRGFGVARAAETELVLGGYGGYLESGIRKSLVPAFERKYNVKVTYVTGTSEQLLAKMEAQRNHPDLDVIWTYDMLHREGETRGLFGNPDPRRLPEWNDYFPIARTPNIGFGVTVQAVGLEYNVKIFKEKGWAPPRSWLDLWDPKYTGHVAIQNMPLGTGIYFLAQISRLQGGSDRAVDRGFAKIKELVPNATFVDTPAQLDQLLSQGDAWISVNGSGRVNLLKDSGVPVEFVYPKEGAVGQLFAFDVVKNAPHPDLARKFFEFAHTAQADGIFADGTVMGPLNSKAKLSPAVAARVPYGPSTVSKLIGVDLEFLAANVSNLTGRWLSMVGK